MSNSVADTTYINYKVMNIMTSKLDHIEERQGGGGGGGGDSHSYPGMFELEAFLDSFLKI